jgi:hypothetical protein
MLIMVIALSGVQLILVWNQTRDYKIVRDQMIDMATSFIHIIIFILKFFLQSESAAKDTPP